MDPGAPRPPAGRPGTCRRPTSNDANATTTIEHHHTNHNGNARQTNEMPSNKPQESARNKSSARESLRVTGFKLLDGNMGVTLGGFKRGVAKHLLHLPQIRATVKQMRGGAVTQSMR